MAFSVLDFSLVTVLPDPDLPKIKFPNNDDLDWLRNLVLCLLKGWDSRVGYGTVEKIRVTLSYRGAVRGFSGCDSMIFFTSQRYFYGCDLRIFPSLP
jgi:hypothetical protein